MQILNYNDGATTKCSCPGQIVGMLTGVGTKDCVGSCPVLGIDFQFLCNAKIVI